MRLLQTFLKICESYGNLKLLLWQFQPNFKFEPQDKVANYKHNISDITILHSYVSQSVWKNIYKFVNKINNQGCIDIMVSFIFIKYIYFLFFYLMNKFVFFRMC